MASFDAAVIVLFGFGTSPTGHNQFLPAEAAVGYGFEIVASGYAFREHKAATVIEFGFDAATTGSNPNGGTPATGLTVRQVVEDVLRMWGLCCDDDIEPCVQDDALAVLNGSMQFIFLHGKDLPFLAKRVQTYYIAEGQRYITLDADVQKVLGNVRDTDMALNYRAALPGGLSSTSMPFASGGKVIFVTSTISDTFDIELLYGTDFTSVETLQQAIQALIVNDARVYVTYYRGRDLQIAFDVAPTTTVEFPLDGRETVSFGTVWRVSDGTNYESASLITTGTALGRHFVPLANQEDQHCYTSLYGASAPPAYYVQCDQSNADGDSSRIRLDLVNMPAESTAWVTMDVLVQPRRVSWSDYSASAPLPFPHRYIESLLLPICRYKATCARRYRQKERHQSVVDQYQEALRVLGWADPQLSEIKEGRAAE